MGESLFVVDADALAARLGELDGDAGPALVWTEIVEHSPSIELIQVRHDVDGAPVRRFVSVSGCRPLADTQHRLAIVGRTALDEPLFSLPWSAGSRPDPALDRRRGRAVLGAPVRRAPVGLPRQRGPGDPARDAASGRGHAPRPGDRVRRPPRATPAVGGAADQA